MLVVVGALQVRRAVKKVKAKRLAAEAAQYFEQNDFQNAAHSIRGAMGANPSSLEAIKLAAELLEKTGSAAALDWRIRATQLDPRNMTNRLDWAQTAVRLHNFKSAEDALSGLDEESRSTARYQKVAGALAWSLGKEDEAQQHYEEARRLEPDNPVTIINLATIQLHSTDDEVARCARLNLQGIAATNSAFSAEALRHLAQDATERKVPGEALAYIEDMATNSTATFADKLDYLNLLAAARNTNAGQWLDQLKRSATNSPGEVFDLGRWLAQNQGFTNAFQWLSSLPLELQTNQHVSLVMADCQIGVKNWTGLLRNAESQNWGEFENVRLALESLAHRSLGEKESAEALWTRARRKSARRLDRLYKLTQLATDWHWDLERRDLLMEIVSEFPHEKWALEMLVAQLHEAGETRELEQVLVKLSAADPSNLKLKASLARLYLLRKNQLDTAYKFAKQAFDSVPDDPIVASTYAYSLLVQGQKDEALRILDSLKPQALEIPWVSTCYGVIEAQSGNKQAAREPLERAKSARLLPEEMELVRHAAAN